MQILKKYISILNWVQPQYTLAELIKIKNFNDKFDQIIKFLPTEKHRSLKLILQSIDRALESGFKIICPTDINYPPDLQKVFNRPTPLMYKGDFKLSRFNIGVVGSRRPQLTTCDWLKSELYDVLCELKKTNNHINIFSGGAYGVDQMAHKVSLLAGVPTICFLPTGVNHCYPKTLEPLADKILDNGGAVVSPFPPDFPIFKSNFYYRNKILVLLSDLILIAEARRRSGTIMTANMAVSSGKSTVVLPQAAIKNCLGSLDLIESGVPIIRCKKDLILTVKELNF